jgi:hypothetical protein
MIDKPIEQITPADLQRLVDNSVPESARLEYKEQFPGSSPEERREFLADVSSLANTAGGDLVFGIAEQRDGGKPTGVPASVDGVSGPVDVLRLENILRDGLAPRIPGIRIQQINGFPRGPVLILRVPRSWQRPHMVTLQQLSRFYARNSQGKYILDVNELRQAFLGAATAAQQARAFVRERIASVSGGEIDLTLESSRAMVVHVVPLVAFEGAPPVNLHALTDRLDLIAPLYSHGFGHRFNLDGLCSYDYSGNESQVYTYMQVFRSGAIEGATTGIFGDPLPDRNALPALPSQTAAETIVAFLRRSLKMLDVLQVDGPVIFSVALLGVKGVILGLSYHSLRTTLRPFARDLVVLPDALIEDRSMAATAAARPVLDALWQAAGLPRSSVYEADGTWRLD